MAWSNDVSAPALILPSTNESSAFLAIQSTIVGVATLLVLARIYVRSAIIKNAGLDDLLIIIGLVSKSLELQLFISLTDSSYLLLWFLR